MIQVVYSGTTVFLINEAPNWAKGYSSEFSCVVDNQASLTKRETRRPYSETLRTTVKCASTVADAALRTLLGQLRQLKAQPVVFPFWPAVSFWSLRAGMKISGGLLIAFKSDWSQYEIYAAGAEPGWPLANDCVAPLLWGYVKNNEPRFKSGSLAEWPIDFVESSINDYALTFTNSAWVDGPKPTGYAVAPKMLPFRQDYRGSRDGFRFDLARDAMGFTRDTQTTSYPHDVYRAQTSQFTIAGANGLSDFLAFFYSASGQGASFWVPSSLESARVSIAAGAAATVITLTGVESIQVNDYICALLETGIVWAKVQGIAGNVVTFFAAFGVALPKGAQLFALNLAELSDLKINVKWKSPVIGTASLSWTEVRPETVIPGNETQGTTIGQLKRRIIILHFWRDYGNGTVVHQYFTSYERDVSWGGNTYTSASFDIDQITKSLNLEDDSCTISSSLVNSDGSLFASNPFIPEVGLTSEVPLNVEVSFSDL